ncbi:AbiTii domain-containing protein [Pseudomonas putida]
MTGLVLELQADALNEEGVPILSLLRKARVVSMKLGVTTIDQWLEHELSGYPTRGSIPEYRRIVGQTVCRNPYLGWIPLEVRGAEAQKMLSERRLHQPMGELCQFAGKGVGESVLLMYPAKMAEQIMNGTDARFEPALEVGVNVIHGIIATVRNKILDFALELERQGILGEGMTFTTKEKTAASNITYSINIENMSGSQLQQGTTNSSQTYNAQGTDLSAVAAFVERLLPAIGELNDATDREQVQSDLDTIRSQLRAPKPKTGMIRECLNSVRTVLEGAAGNVGATYLPQLTALLASIPS